MEKRDFRMLTLYIVSICVSAIALVVIYPASASVVVLMLTLPTLLGWGMYAIVRKIEGR